MITWRGERVLQLAKMILPGNIRHLTQLPHVKRMADELRRGLLTTMPVARRKGGRWHMVTGADELAAHIVCQFPEVRCREVECGDTEARILALSHEKAGLHDEAKILALHEEIDRLRDNLLANPEVPRSVQRGRRRTPVSQAVKEAAKAAGVSERSLMRSYRRRNPEATDNVEPVLPSEPCILDLGMPLTQDFLEKVAAIQHAVTNALDGIERARRAEQKLDALPYPKHALVLADLAEMSERLRKFWPFSLCPYCKGLSGIQESCAACSMQGWLGKGQIEGVPDKLWDKVDRVVMVNGKPKRVAELLPETDIL